MEIYAENDEWTGGQYAVLRDPSNGTVWYLMVVTGLFIVLLLFLPTR